MTKMFGFVHTLWKCTCYDPVVFILSSKGFGYLSLFCWCCRVYLLSIRIHSMIVRQWWCVNSEARLSERHLLWYHGILLPIFFLMCCEFSISALTKVMYKVVLDIRCTCFSKFLHFTCKFGFRLLYTCPGHSDMPVILDLFIKIWSLKGTWDNLGNYRLD